MIGSVMPSIRDNYVVHLGLAVCILPVPKPIVNEDEKTVETGRLVILLLNICLLLNMRVTPLPTIADVKAELAG